MNSGDTSQNCILKLSSLGPICTPDSNWWGRPIHTMPSRDRNGEMPLKREKKKGNHPSDVTHTDNMSLTLLLHSAARITRSRRALCVSFTWSALLFCYARHACYRIILEFNFSIVFFRGAVFRFTNISVHNSIVFSGLSWVAGCGTLSWAGSF